MNKIEIKWPSVTVLGTLITGLTYIYSVSSGVERARLLTAFGVFAATAASLMPALLSRRGPRPPAPRNTVAPGEHLGPPKIKRAWFTLVLTASLVGCGGSALRIHAATALTATEALEVTRLELERVTDQRMAECSDTACVDAVDADMRPVFEARDGARLAVVAYRESVSLAVGAQADDASIVALLSSSAARLACEWGSLSTAVEHLGFMLPALPAGVCIGGGQ
jgi:hypothetical protein